MKPFLKELQERGMVHQFTPSLETALSSNTPIVGYVGFDPTAKSLHVGNLAAIMLLKHLQLQGHTPIILVGGATGMIGDPSGKKSERSFLSKETLSENETAITRQLSKFLDFSGNNAAMVVNNYNWISRLSLIDFLRDVGKNATVNVMMNRDSVANRINDEDKSISFTEFTYQLIQAYDFAHLYKDKGCVLQMGGSDQWGNMTAGIDLLRRMYGGEAHALTCPLLTKADGTKFGKSESGNVWLDPAMTTPFEFYQFWIQMSDDDAAKFVSIFTLFEMEEIEQIRAQHLLNPKEKYLQTKIAEQVTEFVHGRDALNDAVAVSEFLFGNAGIEKISQMALEQFNAVFANMPTSKVKREDFESGDLFDALCNSKSEDKGIFSSKGDARRAVQGGGVSINKKRLQIGDSKTDQQLLHDKFWFVQSGKKNYYLLEVV